LTVRRLTFVNVVLAGTMLLFFVATRPLTGSGPSTRADPGSTFYPLAGGGTGLDIGARAPEFSGDADGRTVDLRDLNGDPVSLAALRGRPVWVVFWATWCPPCQRETPDLRATYEAFRSRGVALVAISIQEPPDTVAAFAAQYGLTYTIALDQTGAISRTYGVFGIPTHYFIDRDGIIRDRSFGPLDRAGMEAKLRALVATSDVPVTEARPHSVAVATAGSGQMR
jgi:peroxiredoxin